LIDGGSVDAY